MSIVKVENELKKILTQKELKLMPRAFDRIGSIIILDIPSELSKKEKKIGQAYLKTFKDVKTICKRTGAHKGVYRIRPVKVIAGIKSTETEYRESGVRLKLDIAKVYFTPRLSFERERIANQVKAKEIIGYFFAGVGPFGLVIAKKQPEVGKVYAIELNPIAFKYLEDNIRINRMWSKITAIRKDVKKLALPHVKFDRIIMPLPKGSKNFLETAFGFSKQGAVIHFYQFSKKDDPFSTAEKLVKNIAKQNNKKITIRNRKIVRPYSPSVVQVVLDLVVS